MSREIYKYQLDAATRQLHLQAKLALFLSTAKPTQAQRDEIKALSEEALAMTPPSLMRRSETHRDSIADGVRNAWEHRRDDVKLYLYEWRGEEPRRVSYEQASEILGYALATLRTRLSQASSKSSAFYGSGRWRVLAKTPDPDAVQAALDEKFVETRNPDDQRHLPKKLTTA